MIQNGENAVYTYLPPDPAAGEKKYVRRAGNAIGLACISIALILRYWYVGLTFITGRLGISQDAVLSAVQNEGVQQLIQVLCSTLCFFVPFLIAAKVMNIRAGDAVPFTKVKKGSFIPYLFIGLAFCAFANISLSYAANVFESLGFSYNMPQEVLPAGVIGFLLYTISTAIVPAMAEEFGCRGLLMGILRPLGDGFAIVVSAIIFGALHGNFIQIPFAFAIGIVLGYIRIKTGSMVICILIHFINNFVSVILDYLEGTLGTAVINVSYILFLCVCFALGFAGLARIDRTQDTGIQPAKTLSGEKKKAGWFFSSPAVIVFLSLELLFSLVWLFY